MNSRTSRIVFFLFVVGLVILTMTMIGTGIRDAVKSELAILLLRKAIGIFIATVAAFVILLRALDGTSLADSLPLLVALFGGLTLLTADWPAVVPLGLVIVGFVVIEVIRLFRPAEGATDE